jgi:ribosome-associated protein
MADDGGLIIEAKRFRSQERHWQDALDCLVTLIRRAAQRPKVRRRTKRTQASEEQRLRTKR